MKRFVLLAIFLLFGFSSFSQRKDYLVKMETSKGDLYLILYEETPLHKANFIKLVKSKFYDNLLFHRVIENFMIQGGDPNSKNAKPGERLGSGGDNLKRVIFEYSENRFHKKGVIAAARDNNPLKESSACQFYIVQGKKFTDEQLDGFEEKNELKYSKEQRDIYKTLGGTPHLDKNYTVFGEVIGSLDALDAIAKEKTDKFNRPIEDQKMKISVKKLKKKKIIKLYGYKY